MSRSRSRSPRSWVEHEFVLWNRWSEHKLLLLSSSQVRFDGDTSHGEWRRIPADCLLGTPECFEIKYHFQAREDKAVVHCFKSLDGAGCSVYELFSKDEVRVDNNRDNNRMVLLLRSKLLSADDSDEHTCGLAFEFLLWAHPYTLRILRLWKNGKVSLDSLTWGAVRSHLADQVACVEH